MHIARSLLTGGLLALVAGGCGSGSKNGAGTGADVGSGGASGTSAGGTSAVSSGGSSASSVGGTSGGTTGGSSGGSSGTSGGSPGSSGSGTSGAAAGGSAGLSSGGSSGNPTGGSAGAATGGSSTAGSGGSDVAGAGGSSTGGQGAAGSGAAGAPAATSALVTSASGAFWKTGTWTEAASATATVTVNDASTAQTWQGFGGAFNEKGWGYLTTQAMKDQAIQLLFGKDGCNFAWGRIPIGASDYAMDRYTDDEVASGSDTSLASFSIDRDKQYLIPYIQAALAVKPDIRFWASPWTPPTWMKTGPYNPNTGASHSNFDGGVMKSDDATLKAYAQYLIKWVQAFKEQGINVELVSAQNEPNYQQNYPSCHWDTSNYVNFVGKYFGPAIAAANMDFKIMDGTLSNPSGDSDIGQQILKDSTAKGFIGAIGVQWGMSDSGQVNTLKNLAGGIPIWLSETKCDGTQNSSGPAPNDMNYGNATWGYITGAIKNGLTAYNAWNMVLDKNGLGIDDTRKWAQNTLLVADSGQVTATPAYYVFRHFSQFVEPNAKVVQTSGGDAIGFKNPDGSLVAVMHNSGGANNNYVVSIGGKKLQFAMPGSGWATLKYVP